MATKRVSASTFLKQHDAHTLSVQLSKLVMDPVDVVQYLDKFSTITTPSSKNIQSFVKLFHRSASGSFDIKMKNFTSNKTTTFNECIQSFHLDKENTLFATKIKSIDAVPQTASSIDVVVRFSFELINHPTWILQIDLVKTLSNPLEFGSKLASTKALIVDVPLEEMSPNAYDHVITSLINIEKQPITHSEILDLIGDISIADSTTESNEYQEEIYGLAKDIFRDAVIVSQFKRQSGFKRLSSNTIELSRPIYFKQVLPEIESFYMTDKMDGTRAMLIIDEVYRRSGHRRIYLGTNIKAVSDQVYTLSSFKKSSESKTIETDHSVLDVEMMVNAKGERTFHCFDIIALKSKRVSNSPFKDRISKFEEVQTLMEKYELGSVKEFVKLSKDTFSKQIKSFYEKKRSYHIDGIIFTPEGMYYKDAAKLKKSKYDRVFNTDYSSTISFKWKPLDQLTIDFYLMSHPSKKGSYVLCSGVDVKTFKQLHMTFFDGYKAPLSNNSHQYFPIQFESYDGSFENVWTPTKEELEICSEDCKTLDGQVGEFAFANSKGIILNNPKLIRLRGDRMSDIAKGEYYGNALRYAELIWHSINYPLTIEAMCDPTDIGYFANDNNDWYKAQRSFNSFVKTHLLETYLYPKSNGTTRILDIACGKGQDIARSIDVGFDEVVAVDKDVDAIYELLERKYNLRVKRRGATANVHVKQLDLEDDSDFNIKKLKLASESVDSAMINFAIHYICHSPEPKKLNPLEEFAKLVGYYLKTGGRLMITTFNGEDIFKLLNQNSEWNQLESGRVKYSIKRSFSSEILTQMDQSIDVLLPFSDGRYYKEYLVNYQYVQEVFEANGFRLVKTDSFESLLRLYKKQNSKGFSEMTNADKEWVALYGYMIFEKN